MPWCRKCGKELPTLSNVCQNCPDKPAVAGLEKPHKPRNGAMKVLHVAPMAIFAWVVGPFIIAVVLNMLEPFDAEPGTTVILAAVLGIMVLSSCIALLMARADTEDLRPIHIVLGSAIGPAIAFVCWLIFRTDHSNAPDELAFLCFALLIIPASVVVGIIRGVRSCGTRKPFISLFWCILLITACCLSAWFISNTFIGRLLYPERNRFLPYTPPQSSIARQIEHASQNSSHKVNSPLKSRRR